MDSSSRPLSERQGIMIAARALCALFLLNALVNASYFPGYLASAWNYWHEATARGLEDSYLTALYIRQVATGVLRLAFELFFAGFFYQCGPRVAKFLLGEQTDEETENSSGETLG